MLYMHKKKFSTDENNKKYHQVKDHCHYTAKYRGAVHDICYLIYKIPNEIPVVFHNGSTYDYYFIIKEFNLKERQSKRKLQKKIRMAMVRLQKYHTK